MLLEHRMEKKMKNRGITLKVKWIGILFAFLLMPICGFGFDAEEHLNSGKFCSATADAIFHSCGFEAKDDYLIAFATVQT